MKVAQRRILASKNSKSPENFIENCEWEFKCPLRYADLTEIPREDYRFCETCKERVYYCNSIEDLALNISQNRCVSFTPQLLNKSSPKFLSIFVFGPPNVGKTSLINQFVDGSFQEKYCPTKEESTAECEILNSFLGLNDTVGSNDFIFVTTATVFVYARDSRQSFEELKRGLEGVESSFIGILVANKSDLPAQVPDSEGEELARKYRLGFVTTSAKDSESTKAAFIIAYGKEKKLEMKRTVMGKL